MLDENDKGRRVELVSTDDPYTKLKPGDKGTYYSNSTVDMGGARAPAPDRKKVKKPKKFIEKIIKRIHGGES